MCKSYMAHGISLASRYTARTSPLKPLPAGASRDRKLAGKARIKARKEANKYVTVPTYYFSSEVLAGMKSDELRTAAKDLGLTKYSHLKVAELRDTIFASTQNRV